MTDVLGGLEWSICLVYIDDLIIFSRTFDEHLGHLEQVFKRLREANVLRKPSNAVFTLELFTAASEFTYLSKFFLSVNTIWYYSKRRQRQ